MIQNAKEGVIQNIGVVLDNQSQSRNGSETLDPKFKYPELQYPNKEYCVDGKFELPFKAEGNRASR
jgi:hypothetical protein